jgi:hypothetical protein
VKLMRDRRRSRTLTIHHFSAALLQGPDAPARAAVDSRRVDPRRHGRRDVRSGDIFETADVNSDRNGRRTDNPRRLLLNLASR